MTGTPNLSLPFIDQNQSQKHVTHNEALRALDAIVQIGIVRSDWGAPPATANEGEAYVVATGGVGAWLGKDGQIACYQNGAWMFYPPRAGWIVYNRLTATPQVYSGIAWTSLVSAAQNLSLLGIGTAATSANPLSVKANAALFAAVESAGGGTGDLRFTLNKEAPAKSVSQLYQSGWSGRAETGLTGDDDFHVKVSADGAIWREALKADRGTGALSFPQGVIAGDRMGFRNLLRNPAFSINQRAVSGTVTLAAGAYGHDGVKAGANGATYTFAANGIDTTLTLSAGSLILPIESVMIAGGDYVLAHEGSAQARVWQGAGASGTGAYATASRSNGLVVAGLAAAAQTNIEFTGGSIFRPQFEAGGVVTQFERRTPVADLALCQRYFYINQLAGSLGMAVTPTDILFGVSYPVTLRAAPTVTLIKTAISSGLYELLVGPTWVAASGLSLGAANIGPTGGLVKVSGFSALSIQTLCMGNALVPFCSFSAEI